MTLRCEDGRHASADPGSHAVICGEETVLGRTAREAEAIPRDRELGWAGRTPDEDNQADIPPFVRERIGRSLTVEFLFLALFVRRLGADQTKLVLTLDRAR